MKRQAIKIIRQKIDEIRACLSELPDSDYQMEQLQKLEDALDRIEEDLMEKV